jgi:hypothetical protein
MISSVAALSVMLSALSVVAASYILVDWQVDVSFDKRRVRSDTVKQTLLAALQANGS